MRQVYVRGGVFGPQGYGGGIFDGSQMGFGGLGKSEQGARAIGTDATTPFVWMGASDARVARLQVALNRELTARGFQPIGTDGQLGPGTCGAIAWLGTLSNVNFDTNTDLQLIPLTYANQQSVCKTFTYPKKVGSATPFVPPSTFHAGLPWMATSTQTESVQKDINNDLSAHGYVPIDETGMLDAPTCGAMKLAKDSWGMDYLTAYGANCQAFTAPTHQAAPVTAPVTTPVTTPVRAPVQKASMTGWVVGGIVAAGALAAVVAMNKKRHAA